VILIVVVLCRGCGGEVGGRQVGHSGDFDSRRALSACAAKDEFDLNPKLQGMTMKQLIPEEISSSFPPIMF
jgi:hypothetical protein